MMSKNSGKTDKDGRMSCRILFAQGTKKLEYEDEGEAFKLLIRTYENALLSMMSPQSGYMTTH